MITATWDWRLIALSYVIAALASYTALDIADRVIKTSRAASRRAWLFAGALVMGVGIWSMHFTGMLAFQPSAMSMSYDVDITVLSALVAVAASGAALFAVSRATMSRWHLAVGGVVMGVGIVSMHYIGMAAMRMPADISYYAPLVALSIAIAVGASLAALRLASRFSREAAADSGMLWLKVGSGLLMGAAIAGMHYTGMAAARFSPDGGPSSGAGGVDNVALGGAIGSSTLVVLGVALVCSMVDRRFAAQAVALAETEQLYTSLFEQSVDALLVHDRDGNMVDCNSEACRSLGYTREELLSMRIADFATNLATEEEKATRVQTLWQRAMDTEPGQVAGVHEGEHVRKDGTSFPIEVRVGSVDYGGERMMFASATDVTARKAAEDARRESEERHRAVVDTAADAIITMSADGEIRSFNAGAGRIFGYAAEEAVGQPLKMLMPERFREHHERGLARYLQTGEARVIGGTVELAGLGRDGEEFPLELSLAETRGDDVRMFVGIIRDITERKAAEQAVRRLASIVDSSGDAIISNALDGTVMTWNPGAEGLFGYSAEEMVGRPVSVLAPAERSDESREAIGRVRRYGSAEFYETVRLHRDGRPIDVSVLVSPIKDDSDNVTGIAAIMRDVTERKRTEEAAIQNERRFRQLFERSVDPIFIHDDDGRILEGSAEACRSLGYTREELRSLHIKDIDKTQVSDEKRKEIWQRVAAGQTDTDRGTVFFGEQVRKDGSVFPVEVHMGGVDYQGRRLIMASVRDMTERKRAEAEAEQLLRRAALRAGVGEALNLGGTMSEVLQGCADAMVEHVPEVSYARIWTLDDDQDKLTLEASSGGGAEPPPLSMSNSSIILEVTRTRRPFVDNDVRSNERLLTRSWARSAGMNAIAGYPLFVESKLVGLVTTLSSEPFPRHAIETLESMIDPIAQGIRRKWAEKRLRDSEGRLRAMTSGAPVILFAVDTDGIFTLVEGRGLESLGIEPGAMEGLSVFEAYADSPEVLGHVRRALAGEEVAATVEIDGMTFEARYSPLREPGGEVSGAIGVATDVSERQELERELQHRAFHDPLTGLPNRALFNERLEQGLARARRGRESLAVLFLDLDNFKLINDSLSHDVGDGLLVEVAQRLRSCLRGTDTAARLGGDEFTVLVEEISDESGAAMVAERIADALSEPFDVSGHELPVTFSIGIAVSTGGEGEPAELLRDADVAMYRAKSGGKARYEIFDDSMNTRALERLELETDLRRAVDRGEITAHYQPKVRVETGEVCGMEALARWTHPEKGKVSPADFIPVAEETGLILPLTLSMLEQACHQTKRWQESYQVDPPLAVSVNVSAKQLQSDELADSVRRVLRESGLPPSDLTLEITESVMMQEAEANARALHKLKELGVKLAVDDFGKGYSSLSYLRHLPVDIVKIDRAFVDGLGESAGDMAIVSSVITYANALGLTVVAEGVENAEQLAVLRDLGCELAQGFYLDQPLPPGDMEELLRAGEPLAEPEAGETAEVFGNFSGAWRAAASSRVINRSIAESKDCIVISDPNQPDHPMVYVNRSFERLTGYTAEESIGHNCRFLQNGDTDQPELDCIRAALAAGKEWSGIIRNYRKDGRLFYNELSISPVRDEAGHLISYIGVQNDVTERIGQDRSPVRRDQAL